MRQRALRFGCGTWRTARGARVVAILFADLCGSTALANELGAEGMHRLLTRYFELVDGLVEQCGGTVDKHMGDGVMALFGAPVAYGNDTMRALRAAAAIHQALETLAQENGRPLAAHVGVASGEVVAADTGSAVHRNYTVTGDAVNLAARPPRARARRRDRDLRRRVSRVRVVDRGRPRRDDGDPRVRAGDGRLEAALAARRCGAEHPLLGRDGRGARFEAFLQAVEGRRHGQRHGLVRADPGMGKTRLVQEIVVHARRRGFARTPARCSTSAWRRAAMRSTPCSQGLLAVSPEAIAPDRRAALDRAVTSGAVAPRRTSLLPRTSWPCRSATPRCTRRWTTRRAAKAACARSRTS
jgi:hypothetical protein